MQHFWTFDLPALLTLLTMGGAVVTAAVKVIRAADRVTSVLRDFPPHRHVNGLIVYPDGYAPSIVEHLPQHQ